MEVDAIGLNWRSVVESAAAGYGTLVPSDGGRVGGGELTHDFLLKKPKLLDAESQRDTERRRGSSLRLRLARKLLQLVIREDEFQKEIIRASNDTLGYGDVLGEGYGEYAAQALEECLRYCEKEGILEVILADARQGPTRRDAVELLANVYSRFGYSVDQRVRIDDVIIDATSDPTSFLTRWSAVSALGPAILTGHDLPPLERQRIHRTVIGAVGDAWADVRISAIGRIAEFGDPADSALLSRIAEQDTARATSHGREVYPVRDAARRAMEDIGRVQRPAPPQGR